MKLGVVIPVYGNEGSLPELYDRLVASTSGLQIEVVFQFVNDRSPDGSQAVLEGLAAKDPRVRVLLLSKNHGSFVAIVAGLHEVIDCDAVAILSADLQDPPEKIPEMVQAWKGGHPVVLCVRKQRMESWSTRLFSSLFNRAIRLFVMPEMPKGGFDFCLIDRRVTQVVVQSSEKSTSLVGLILWSGFSRAFVHYDRAERKHGRSMWSFRRKFRYAINTFISFSALPIQIVSIAGLLLALLCILLGVSTAWNYFMDRISVSGWTSLILAVLTLGAFQLISLGILGEYFWNNLEQTRKRPLFIVDRKLGGTPAILASDRVLLFSPAAVSDGIMAELETGFRRVMSSQHLILGPEVEAFERELGEYLGVPHVVAVANGTDALTLSLWAAGVGRGDGVLVPAISAPPTAVAVLRAGARPVFVDVDPETLTIDPNRLGEISDNVKAIIPVHLYGNPCAMDEIMRWANRHHVKVVEDCAQSMGSLYYGRQCGTMGAFGAFSFYPTKNLGGYGDGGAVVTQDEVLAQALRCMRFYGQDKTGECVEIGFNSRLDELQASLLRVRLRKLIGDNQERAKIARAYDKALSLFSPIPSRSGRVPHLYVIRVENRTDLRKHLRDQGVETGIHYALSLPEHKYLREHGVDTGCPVAEAACRRVVSLPCYPGLSDESMRRVIDACQQWEKRRC